jgi:Flp pilus assembly protein TadD
MYVSSDARTFKESDDWRIAESGPQSLAADLIHDGITGIAGHVADPYLEATIRPDILFPSYLSGFNLIESYYLSMPYLSWQTVVVGDPLCAPFRKTSMNSTEIDKGIDPETEFPVDFGVRRLKALSVAAFNKAGIHPDTIKLILKSEARLTKDDKDGARKALEEVVARDDRLPMPQFQLASLYEFAGDYDKAIERYRRLQQLTPANPLVLNNLAYALAVRKNQVQEALPIAEKANELAKGKIANITDTLGWIYHLAGQDDRAAKLLEEAVRSGTNNADMNLHFAVVSAATGNKLAAEVALKRALEIDPKLEQSEEVKQLRAKMK